MLGSTPKWTDNSSRRKTTTGRDIILWPKRYCVSLERAQVTVLTVAQPTQPGSAFTHEWMYQLSTLSYDMPPPHGVTALYNKTIELLERTKVSLTRLQALSKNLRPVTKEIASLLDSGHTIRKWIALKFAARALIAAGDTKDSSTLLNSLLPHIKSESAPWLCNYCSNRQATYSDAKICEDCLHNVCDTCLLYIKTLAEPRLCHPTHDWISLDVTTHDTD